MHICIAGLGLHHICCDLSDDHQLTNMTDGSQQHSSMRQQQHRAARLGVVHVQDTRESTLLAQKHRVLLFLLFAFLSVMDYENQIDEAVNVTTSFF